jgi:AmmeMemoRadiSam system protein B
MSPSFTRGKVALIAAKATARRYHPPSVPSPLPRLRVDLDIMPSPLKEQPGLLMRDPFRFSEITLVVPPLLARCLGCFDGEQTELDLHAALTRLTGAVTVSQTADHLIRSLREAGFLDDETFARLRLERQQEFVAAPARAPAHAGSGYPAEADALTERLAGYLALDRAGILATARSGSGSGPGPAGARPRGRSPRRQAAAPSQVALAAPHVSPEGGAACYGAAYRALGAELADRTFVILGTSHYGEPDRFGLTRKPFTTPLGQARTDVELVGDLAAAAGGAVTTEDYCHAVEHSVEFQVVFLQHRFGPGVRILPVLCGAFVEGPAAGRPPEASQRVARFLNVLGEMSAREGNRLFFVLGVDMAHVGQRYGDPLRARAGHGPLVEVADRDRLRMERIADGDADGFWRLVHGPGADREDDLKWCGSSPFYTFLRAIPGVRGDLLRYQQWNIDEASVVSFGAMSFYDGG